MPFLSIFKIYYKETLMKFSISEDMIKSFPDVCIGIVIGKEIDNSGNSARISNMIKEKEQQIIDNFNIETLSQEPKINVWRKAYSSFGAKPKDNKSSIESLYRNVLKGNEVRHINKLVDIYNFISLKHMLPVGGEDLDKIEGNVELKFAGPDEPPVLLLGDREPRAPKKGEVIYSDDVGAICRRWNWREADRTKFSEKTKNCMLVVEGLLPVTRNNVRRATFELEELVEKYCGGIVSNEIIDCNRRSIDF